MCNEDIFEGLLQEIIYCDASGHTEKWEETDWREWLRPQIEETYQKAENHDQMKVILEAFFSERANESDFTDYMECYETLGKLKDLTVDTSEKRIQEKS